MSFVNFNLQCLTIMLSLSLILAGYHSKPSPLRPLPSPRSLEKRVFSFRYDGTKRPVFLNYHLSCSVSKRRLIDEAWQGAGRIAQAHTSWHPSGNYQDVMDSCLGTQSRNDIPKPGQSEGPLRRNVLRASGVFNHDSQWSPLRRSIEVHCGDRNARAYWRAPESEGCEDGSNRKIYSWWPHGYLQYLILCPPFFDLPSTTLLVDGGWQDSRRRQNIALWVNTKEYTLLNEVWQFPYVAKPKCRSLGELTPDAVVRLAQEGNTHGNADFAGGLSDVDTLIFQGVERECKVGSRYGIALTCISLISLSSQLLGTSCHVNFHHAAISEYRRSHVSSSARESSSWHEMVC